MSPPTSVRQESAPNETVGMKPLVVSARKPTTSASVEKTIARPAVWWAVSSAAEQVPAAARRRRKAAM